MDTYFSKKNIIGISIGIFLLVLGYVCLAQGPATNRISLDVAPVILVIGYVVVLPISILLGGKSEDKESDSQSSDS